MLGMEHACEAVWYGIWECQDTAIGLYRVGCEHEHTRDMWLCAFHSRIGSEGEAVCGSCHQAGHRCRTMVVPWQHDDRT